MDKIWYRNPLKSEVIGCCGGDEKTNDHAEPTKVERSKTTKNTTICCKNLQITSLKKIKKIEANYGWIY